MRIIGGELGGRRIAAPKGMATRPTSDRVRESLFSILGPPPADLCVLDLFAGAGTLGLESLSRGAQSAVFVESARPALSVLRSNIASLAVGTRATVAAGKLPSALFKGPARDAFGWVFIDPPYASTLAMETLSALEAGPQLSVETVIVVEHDRRQAPDAKVGSLVRTDHRRYGDTELSFYRKGNA